ncbi:MAG: hypothetical protein Q9227_002314 [Pyrenula ochraceoflavens]
MPRNQRVAKWLSGLDEADLSEDGSIPDAEIAAEAPVDKMSAVDEKDEKIDDVSVADDEGEEEEGDDEEEYVVEKVLGHEWHKKAKKNILILYVKWKGYDNPDDRTMEPEANLEYEPLEPLSLSSSPADTHCRNNSALEAYFESLGGRPDPSDGDRMPDLTKTNGTSKKRKSNPNLKDEVETVNKRGRKSKNGVTDEDSGYMPSGKSWENEVKEVHTIERDSRTQVLNVFLEWTNGSKAQLDIHTAYKKFPQHMLKFYESHL